MYKKEIVTHEFVYSEAEQERLIEIRSQIKNILLSGNLHVERIVELIDEMNDILNNEWSPPMPF